MLMAASIEFKKKKKGSFTAQSGDKVSHLSLLLLV